VQAIKCECNNLLRFMSDISCHSHGRSKRLFVSELALSLICLLTVSQTLESCPQQLASQRGGHKVWLVNSVAGLPAHVIVSSAYERSCGTSLCEDIAPAPWLRKHATSQHFAKGGRICTHYCLAVISACCGRGSSGGSPLAVLRWFLCLAPSSLPMSVKFDKPLEQVVV
jgi:hypothetical protein